MKVNSNHAKKLIKLNPHIYSLLTFHLMTGTGDAKEMKSLRRMRSRSSWVWSRRHFSKIRSTRSPATAAIVLAQVCHFASLIARDLGWTRVGRLGQLVRLAARRREKGTWLPVGRSLRRLKRKSGPWSNKYIDFVWMALSFFL